MCLLLVLVRVTNCRLDGERLPDGAAKERLLRAIEKARQVIALASALKVIGLSLSRYHGWRRRDNACELTDRSSCPRKSPGQLTVLEIENIRELATSSEYRHMPTSTLSRFAQRAGKVHASASTWLRLIRERGWRRPRTRIHPAKPTVGIRASQPNEIWHLDVTVIRLLNGTKLCLHGVVDNFSRRLVTFYVREFNEVMPHGALDWRTPDEVHFGRAEDVPSQLETARCQAREARLVANRAMKCETCRASPATAFSDAA